MSESAGQTFGPYQIVRRLGVGGMAETFEAVRRGPGDFSQRVCLKLVLPFFRDKPDFLRMFEQEARLAAKLRHSNVVGVIDFGKIEGVTYIALELVDGIDLATLLDAQPGHRLPHDHVALLAADLARALEHAHDPDRAGDMAGGPSDLSIVHRDVSPSNVMISARGEILLSDFGVAKAIEGAARQPSSVKGKVPYMSPEQLRQEPLDGRSDLFGLGVVLYEALAGERPYQGEHEPATIMMILRGDRPPLRSLAPGAPAALCDVVERLLEPRPEDRPANATELLDMLDPVVPAPRTRRQLGELVRESRAAALTRASEPPARSDETTDLGARAEETGGVGGMTGEAAPDASAGTGDRGSGKRRVMWALAMVALLGVAIAIWAREAAAPPAAPESFASPDQNRSTPSVVDEEGPKERVVEAQSADVTGDDSTAAQAPNVDERAVEPQPEPARLSVVVFPWGDVWINGRRRGPAPIKNVSLEPGRYVVSAGQGAPSTKRRVRLRAGERRTLEFDLTN